MYDVALAPHCPMGPIALAACMQVGTSSANCTYTIFLLFFLLIVLFLFFIFFTLEGRCSCALVSSLQVVKPQLLLLFYSPHF